MVDRTVPRPEYPRPQLVRSDWLNLNGVWEFQGAPNINTPPEHSPLEDELKAKIATVQPDNISTGDLAPDGVIVMSYRSNIPAIAEFTFQHRDKDFRKRMQEWGAGFIVGGHNYGQGSSREHAALAPLGVDPAKLGARVKAAKPELEPSVKALQERIARLEANRPAVAPPARKRLWRPRCSSRFTPSPVIVQRSESKATVSPRPSPFSES